MLSPKTITINGINDQSLSRRYLDVDSTFFQRHGRQMDVETTLCANLDNETPFRKIHILNITKHVLC